MATIQPVRPNKPTPNTGNKTTPAQPLKPLTPNESALKNVRNHSLAAKMNSGKSATKAAPPSTGGLPNLTPLSGPPQAVQAPSYTAPDKFQYNYDYLNFDTAKQRAEERYNPLYNQAVEGVNAQSAVDKQNNAENAANRGGAHSGLMQDMITKLEIAKQGQLANLSAQKMTNVADYAQNLLDKDTARGDALRAQMFNEYASNRDFGYNQYRDQVGDSHWETDRNDSNYWNQIGQNNIDRDYNRGVYEDDRNFNYGKERDKRADYVDDRNFNYGKSQDAIHNGQIDRQFGADQKQRGIDNAYRERDWNQLSPAEKMRMSIDFKNSLALKKATDGGGGGSRGRRSSKGSKSKSKSYNDKSTKNPSLKAQNRYSGKNPPNKVPMNSDAYYRKMAQIMDPEGYEAFRQSYN